MNLQVKVHAHVDILIDNTSKNSDEINALILDNLKYRYTKRCINNAFCLDVNRVLARDHLMIHDDNGKIYTTNVQFVCDIVRYGAGDIVHNCSAIITEQVSSIVKFFNNADSTINIQHKKSELDNFDISSEAKGLITTITNSLNSKNIVPILISSAMYPVNTKSIICSGTIYFPYVENNTVYKIIKDFTDADKDKLIEHYQHLDNAIKIMNSTDECKNETVKKFAQSIIYPFNEEAKQIFGDSINITLDNLLKVSDYVYMPSILNKRHMTFYTFGSISNIDNSEETTVIETSALNVARVIINIYVKYINNVVALCKTYCSKQTVNNNIIYFKFLNDYKNKFNSIKKYAL